MPLTTLGRDALLTSGASAITHLGAITALTPTEVSGGSYARQPITWGTSSGGIRDNSAQIVIPIPASTTVIAVCGYSASTAGTMYAYGGIGSSLLKGVGAIESTTTDLIRSNGHGLILDDRVMVFPVAGETLPSPLSATSNLYYACTITTDTFQLSTSAGAGAIVNLTALGELGWAKTIPETFSSAGNLTIAAGAYDLDLTFG